MANLRMGDRGPLVKRLQRLLNSALTPSPGLAEDGSFGRQTHDAVVRLQQAKRLDSDGIVGPKTWLALGQRATVSPETTSAPPPSAGAPWLEIAQLELGVHEDSQPGAHNQRILEYHSTTTLKATTDEVPWCSSFVNWVMKKAGHAGTNNALAASWLEWGVALETPREGAITVIRKIGATEDAETGSRAGNHVGFLVRATATHVRLLGGNQSDQVRYSDYPLAKWKVRGYRWPR